MPFDGLLPLLVATTAVYLPSPRPNQINMGFRLPLNLIASKLLEGQGLDLASDTVLRFNIKKRFIPGANRECLIVLMRWNATRLDLHNVRILVGFVPVVFQALRLAITANGALCLNIPLDGLLLDLVETGGRVANQSTRLQY